MMIKVIVCAPFQDSDHSNGILGMLYLASTLQKYGCTVEIGILASHPQENSLININVLNTYNDKKGTNEYNLLQRIKMANAPFNLKILANYEPEYIDQFLVVYPEVISSNPLNSKKIVRYFGNKNGILTGVDAPLKSNEFKLAHSRSIDPTADHILFFPYINPIFNDIDTAPLEVRSMNCYYIGKGYLYGSTPAVPDAFEITRHFPHRKSDLAYLLKRTKFLFTYDVWTNLNVEAVMCGAIPVFLANQPFSDDEIDSCEVGELPRVKFGQTDFSSGLFDEFRSKRLQLINTYIELNNAWDPSVIELIDKLKAHFSIE
jgi:hypothetical protein